MADDADRKLKKASRIQRQLDAEEADAVRNAITGLMRHREGRLFVWWLLSLGHIGRNPYTGHALDTAHNCGAMNVGLQIQAEVMQHAPDEYTTMMKEKNSDASRIDAELAARSDPASDDNDTPSSYGDGPAESE